MNVAFDTNRYRDFSDGVAEVVEVFQRADELLVPLFVLGELRAGFANGSKEAENESVLRTFLGRPGVRVLCPDEATTLHYGRIWSQLRRNGKAIPSNDLWIAALCIQHSLALYTRDKHFDVLPQLVRV